MRWSAAVAAGFLFGAGVAVAGGRTVTVADQEVAVVVLQERYGLDDAAARALVADSLADMRAFGVLADRLEAAEGAFQAALEVQPWDHAVLRARMEGVASAAVDIELAKFAMVERLVAAVPEGKGDQVIAEEVERAARMKAGGCFF